MDGIVRRLMKKNKEHTSSLKESLLGEKYLYEVGEDEEEDEFTPEDEEVVEPEETEEISDEETEDDSFPSSRPSFSVPSDDEYIPDDEAPESDPEPEEPKNTPEDKEPEPDNVNPLDNQYAVKFKIGDEVLLAYSNGTNSKLGGIVDGYDPEGFYRIKWGNGLTTNGITDIALGDIVEKVKESACVCGGTKFVTENDTLVCDACGRRIRESTTLPDANKKKKNPIRGEAHPMTTAHPIAESDEGYAVLYNYDGDELSDYQSTLIVNASNKEEALRKAREQKPEGRHFQVDTTVGDKGYIKSISGWKKEHPQSNRDVVESKKKSVKESIRSAFSKKKVIKESAGDEVLEVLISELDGEFWTRKNEMQEDIEELGFEVLELNDEYVVVSAEDEEIQIYLGGTARTITLDFNRARIV